MTDKRFASCLDVDTQRDGDKRGTSHASIQGQMPKQGTPKKFSHYMKGPFLGGRERPLKSGVLCLLCRLSSL